MTLINDLRSKVSSLPWFHSIDLGGGVLTPGAKTPDILNAEAEVVFKHYKPGMSVLDVGAWDGFFSFTAKQRGAARVLATDHFSWVGGGWGKKASFDLARETLGLDIDQQIIDPMDMTTDTVAKHDFVLFLGVLYHLKHPLFVLERIGALATHQLVMETQLDLMSEERPARPSTQAANSRMTRATGGLPMSLQR